MGKYIKKSKLTGDVSVKDISQPTTRATKNIALHRLRSHSDDSDSFNYLQLRSRRLVKLPLLPNTKKQQQQQPQLIQCVHECQTRNPRAKSVPAKKLDFESEEWGKKETTPCSSNLIRDSKAIQSELKTSLHTQRSNNKDSLLKSTTLTSCRRIHCQGVSNGSKWCREMGLL